MKSEGSGWLCWLVGAAAFWLSGSAAGQEPAWAFLEGLRARGYYDTALDYLDSLPSDPLAPDGLRETADFERAVTLVMASRTDRDVTARRQRLDEAENLLRRFVSQRPDHLKVSAARIQLGNLIIERARSQLQPGGVNRAEFAAQARQRYDEAYQVFAQQQADLRAQLEQMPQVLDPRDPEQAVLVARRTQLRADFLQTQLLAAAIREEAADTFPQDSAEYRELLTDAAQQYEEIYRRYRTRLAGLYARLFQGRVNQKLGKYRDALGFYVELLDQPDEPEAFRRLKSQTLRLAIDCWLHPSQGNVFEAIRRGSDWLSQAGPEEERDPEWLAIRLGVARAHLAQAEEAERASPPDRRQATASRNNARKFAEVVAQFQGELQAEAQRLLIQLGGPDLSDALPEVRTFADARRAGSAAVDAVAPVEAMVAELSGQLASAQEAATRAELEPQLEDAQRQLAAARGEAYRLLRLALRLAGEDTPAEDVNLVRYLLAYLYYSQQSYYEAAIVGEFVARRFPGSSAAPQCAKIALACYYQLYNENSAADKQFEGDRVISIARYIIDTWPEHPEAEEALATIIPFLVSDGQLGQARRFLALLPASSQQRSGAALRTGRAMWRSYLAGARDLEVQQEAGDRESNLQEKRRELDALKIEARDVLDAGYQALPDDPTLDEISVTALLCLAQANLETQRAAEAVQLLEDSRLGPLTLVRGGHAATKIHGFAEETYRTALRAYIALLASPEEGEAAVQRARALMAEMQAEMGQTPDSQQRLVSVYLGLARELERQLRAASPATRQTLSRGLEAFLSELGSTSGDLSVLNWVAETFAGFAEALNLETAAGPGPDALRYYDQSAAAFRHLLENSLSPEKELQIRVRLADVHRSAGRYDEALAILRDVLIDRNTALNIQVDAAVTLERAERWQEAISGSLPDPASGQNVVWGWGRIAQVAGRYPQFVDVFHEARFHLAQCRFRLAQDSRGDKARELLELAAQDISLTERLYGLGNAQRQQQYETLLDQIQQAQVNRD